MIGHFGIMNFHTVSQKHIKVLTQRKLMFMKTSKKKERFSYNTAISPLGLIRTYISMYHSCTSATRSSKGSSQPTLHSQWLSRKVSTGAVAASAPRTRDRMRPVQNIQLRTNTDSI
jgi:hypothetical protein